MLRSAAERTGQGNVAEVDDYAALNGTLTRTDFTHYTYDPITGGQATITTADGTIHYVYDPATGNLVETWTSAAAAAAKSAAQNDVLYGYDAQGRLASVTQAVLNGSVPPAVAGGTRYDADGHAIATTEPTTVYTYDAAGNLLADAEPNGDTTAYTYNGLNQLTDESITNGAGHPLFGEHTDWADDGQKRDVVDTRGDGAGNVTSQITYDWTYDADDRLAAEALAVQSGGGPDVPPAYADAYTYDLDNNRVGKAVDGGAGQAGGSTVTYTYDCDDQLKTETRTGVLAHQTTSTYDADGNLRAQVTIGNGATNDSYGYDLQNRMISAAVGGQPTTYEYNADGILITETTAGTTTYDLNDPNNPTGYTKAVQQSSDLAGPPTTSYALGLGVEAQSDLTRGGTLYLLIDGHGSTRALAGINGGVVAGQTFDYDAFGTMLTNAGTAQTDWGFGGDGTRDAATGFTNQLARWRNGESFTTTDFGGSGNDANPLTLGSYLYANGNPISNTDPTGHDALSDEAFAEAGLVQNEAMGSLTGIMGAAHVGVSAASNSESLDTSYLSAATFGSGSVFGGVASTVEAGISATANWLDADPTSVYQGAVQGAWAGLLNVADKFSGGSISSLHNYRNQYWNTTGLAGTSTETGSNVAAWVSVAAFSLADAIGAVQDLAGACVNGCFVAATPVLLGDGSKQAIGNIQVGERVATDGGIANSSDGKTASATPDATSVYPATWRTVTYEIDDEEGGIDNEVEIQALEPISEIAQLRETIGTFVTVPFDLAEMGVPNVAARVMSIGACPTIAAGPGRVVLATISHLNTYMFDLTLAANSGQTDTIGVAGYHRIYTEDRGWVNADQLVRGEQVRSVSGDLTVTSLVREPGAYRVYNIDVEDDHDYYAGDLSALVHNFCGPGQLHHIEPKYLGGSANGDLIWLPKDIHVEVHSVLSARLKAELPGCNLSINSGTDAWNAYFQGKSALRAKALQIATETVWDVISRHS